MKNMIILVCFSACVINAVVSLAAEADGTDVRQTAQEWLDSVTSGDKQEGESDVLEVDYGSKTRSRRYVDDAADQNLDQILIQYNFADGQLTDAEPEDDIYMPGLELYPGVDDGEADRPDEGAMVGLFGSGDEDTGDYQAETSVSRGIASY